ncbi:MAG: double-strand break repair helicase AddA [Rhodobiaceae bacterium]|nr:double-strand break repair helicase AddA [Rhodobiaceae bacterium]
MSTTGTLTIVDTTRRQAAAADPAASVWVSANAGSGKTHVLINRVIRLLLSGTDPERILCLTFTKAAASEMASRLYDRLGEWAVMDEAGLAEKLRELEGVAPDAAKLLGARLLFARAIETPGGLKIQTIHAFCERLLGRFPLEAGVPPHFEILDERTATELMAEARDEILSEIGEEEQAGAQGDVASAFETVSSLVGEYGFDDLFREIVGKRAQLTEQIASAGGVDGVLEKAAALLHVGPEETEDGLIAAAAEVAPLQELREALPLLQAGNKTDVKTATAMAAFLNAPTDMDVLDNYKTAFLKQDGGPKKLTPSIITKKVHEAHPHLLDLLEREQARILELEEQRRAARIVASTHALYVLAAALLERFADLKKQWAVLDYEDLILKSRDLLNLSSAAAWVLYKLDGGLDHILVDEAQDTSPHQWEVIQALAEEFLSGEGARDLTRTIFAVGDEKQSIFSFQGADPAKFAEMKTHFAAKVEGAGKAWNPVDLLLSFRSTREVLSAVDQVFATEETATGLNAEAEPPTHYPFRDLDAGLVEIWPTCVPDEEEEALPWDAPLDYPNAQSPEAKLADRIASTIAHWLATKENLKGEGRPIEARDILILVRRRNVFVEEVIRALKRRDVPVAGTDRMVLTDQIAVMDLMAAAAFALLPEDDLTLATVLKSPLVGLEEDALFDLAHGREGTLWQALTGRKNEKAQYQEAYELLSSWRTRADQMRPYEFFAQLLVADKGRRKLRARLGADVDDPVDEFLSLALGFERTHTPSLQSFLHWVEAGEAEVKREMAEGRDEVRIMTVHGAKGLEAPIVFLPDTCSVPGGQHDPKLIPAGPESEGLLLFPGRKVNDDPVAASARDRLRTEAMNEYRRLLYVAMTRAKDRLYVSGYEGSRESSPDCWYKLIERGLVEDAEEVTAWDGEPVRRIEGEQRRDIKSTAPKAVAAPRSELPGWASRPPPPEPVPARPLAPSKLVEDFNEPTIASPLSQGGADRFKRGRLIHRLLETLPDISEDKREAAAQQFLASDGLALSGDEQAEIASAVHAVLAAPSFAPLFGPGSRAEVSLVGEVERGGERLFLSGQIDRLLVTPQEVLIIDYKTNRPPPARVEDASPAYIAQMAGYAALLGNLYPDRTIRAALLWTDGPNLMEIPAEMLAKAL